MYHIVIENQSTATVATRSLRRRPSTGAFLPRGFVTSTRRYSGNGDCLVMPFEGLGGSGSGLVVIPSVVTTCWRFSSGRSGAEGTQSPDCARAFNMLMVSCRLWLDMYLYAELAWSCICSFELCGILHMCMPQMELSRQNLGEGASAASEGIGY